MDEEKNNLTGETEPTPTEGQPGTAKTDPALPSLETYKDDIARAIKNDKISAVKIATAESKNRENKPLVESLSKPAFNWRSAILIGLSAILLIAGTGLLIYFFATQKPTSGVTTTEDQNLVTVDSAKTVAIENTGRPAIIKTLQHERDSFTIPLSNVVAIKLGMATTTAEGVSTFEQISKKKLLNALAINAPTALERALGEKFLIGFHMQTYKEFYLMIQVTSYDIAYSEMLEWERRMADDIGPLLVRKNISASGGAVTAVGSFADAVIDNRDTRVLKDSAGTPQIIYSFPDRKTLVITTNEITLKNLFNRFRTAALTR